MTSPARPLLDEALVQRLPLPLAQLYRRAHNAKTPLERHHAAFYLWEASLKLLGSVAVIAFAEQRITDDKLTERLQNLARPATGHWWEFVRLLVPVLADAGDASFAVVRDLLLGRTRDDLPRCAGLDAVLLEALEGKSGGKATVELSKLFDRLVSYRNKVFGHGAAGQHPAAFYERNGSALLAAMGELLGKLDVLAGRRLLYIAEVRQRGDGSWLIERGDLSGEMYKRLESDVKAEEDPDRPRPERLYLHLRTDAAPLLTPLHPLLVFDADANEVLFLNSRRGKKRIEYLSYTTGRVAERDGLAGEQRELLRRVLGLDVGAEQMDAWAERSRAGESAEPAAGWEEVDASRPLGEFVRLSKLGEGGMGEVFRAWQPSLDRQVALKCLFRTGDPRAEARFRREIHALGRVEHPHLVKIFTSGSDGDRWYYAMELIEGATLASVCESLQSCGSSVRDLDLPTWRDAVSSTCTEARKAETPLTPNPSTRHAEHALQPAPVGRAPHAGTALRQGSRDYIRHVVALVQQIADATHALHEKGIIHRDIKPGNIMVSADGSSAYLMDLGLAQLADEVEGKLTKTRQFVGTLRYASPEQVLAVAKLDAVSDVYSLGATLWELLTLQPLYGAKEGTPDVELMRRIQFEEPGRLRKHHPGVPRDLEAIVEKALQKDPRRRYGSAAELAAELDAFLENRPVKARPVGRVERGWKWAKRHPVPAALLVVISFALVSLLTLGTWFTWSLDRALQKAEAARKETDEALGKEIQARQETQKAADKAKKAQQFLASIFLLSDPDRPGETLSARQILDDAEKRIPLEFANQPELLAELMATIDGVYAKLQAKAPLAMILEARGKIELHSARASPAASAPGAATPGAPRTPGADAAGLANVLLYHGDRLKLAADANVQLVVLRDLHKERLKPGAEAIIRRKGCEPSDAVSERSNEIVWTFARLPKGTFYMGWDDTAKPPKKGVKTEIKEDFEIACHTVTQGQWQAVMGKNPSYFSRFDTGRYEVKAISDEELKLLPVESVSWNDAQEFIKKLNEQNRGRGCLYRLPTEAEWEYACRAGATSEEECSFHFYFDKLTNDLSSEQANFNGNFPFGKAPKGKDLGRTTRVGAYPSNKLGLCDMHGNVWQWCGDFWEGRSRRVQRGGSWTSSNGADCRAAYRFGHVPKYRFPDTGFRLARVPVRQTDMRERPGGLLIVSKYNGNTNIFQLDATKKGQTNLTNSKSTNSFPAWSPDGKMIAFASDRDGTQQIYVMDLDGSNVRQLTTGTKASWLPSWSADGKNIAFCRNSDKGPMVFVMTADGGNAKQVGVGYDPALSPDGKKILFASRGDKGFLLHVMDVDGGNIQKLTDVENVYGYVYPAWSPDGKRIAFSGMVGGSLEIVLADPDGGNSKVLTKLGGTNTFAVWSPDGKSIAFRHWDDVGTYYIMDADGGNLRVFYRDDAALEGARPAWRPTPAE